MDGVNNAFCMSKEEYELARLATKCAGLQGKIDDQAAEITRIDGEYQEACRLVAQMHLSAVGGVVGPKRGVVEDIADMKAERDAFESDISTIAQHNIELMQERDALKDALELLYSWANNWDSEFMNDPDWKNRDVLQIQEALAKLKEE